MMKECNQCQQSDASTDTSESMWPSIPDSLLWTIKNKLEFFDNTCLSAVCRNWWLGSASYSRDQFIIMNGMPCLTHARQYYAQICKEAECGARQEFTCVGTRRKFSTNWPQFQTHFILYSKKGWLLLMQKKHAEPASNELGVLLLNPIMEVEISLPSILQTANQDYRFGSFSIDHEGYPDRVVLLELRNHNYEAVTIMIKTAYPRDSRWTTTISPYCNRPMNSFCSFMTVGQHAYVCNSSGLTLACNMDTKEAWILARIPNNYKYLTEFEGQVVEVSINRSLDEFNFFRFNFSTSSLEKLSSNELKDTNWFLVDDSEYGGRFCFGKRGEGVKVYHIRHQIKYEDASSLGDYRAVCYDLMDGGKEISLPFRVNSESIWVDI